jgi:hypothetical protein
MSMEKSENVSTIPSSFTQDFGPSPQADMLPFSGLGFDLRRVMARRIRVATVGNEDAPVAAPPMFDTVIPSGRRLQLRLGREIRGR